MFFFKKRGYLRIRFKSLIIENVCHIWQKNTYHFDCLLIYLNRFLHKLPKSGEQCTLTVVQYIMYPQQIMYVISVALLLIFFFWMNLCKPAKHSTHLKMVWRSSSSVTYFLTNFSSCCSDIPVSLPMIEAAYLER